MVLESNLNEMAKHIQSRLQNDRLEIKDSDGKQTFEKAVYGEPNIITDWPLCSVQPAAKSRDLRGGATRKFEIRFQIFVILYHGEVGSTLSVQQGTHSRIEAIEQWFLEDFKWNFVDPTDKSKDKVIFGHPANLDHPIVVAREGQLWSASRIELTGLSEEMF